MQVEEVSELKFIHVDSLENMINFNNDTVFKNDEYMKLFFEKLKELI